MDVRITKKSDIPLPKYQTPGSVGFDFASNEDRVIQPGELALVKTGLVIGVPQGYFLMIAPRSSTSMKKGLIFPNSMGVIDQDYSGPDDEIHLMLYNFTQKPVSISKGERLANGIFVKIEKANWKKVEMVSSHNRGGFGSTGM